MKYVLHTSFVNVLKSYEAEVLKISTTLISTARLIYKHCWKWKCPVKNHFHLLVLSTMFKFEFKYYV